MSQMTLGEDIFTVLIAVGLISTFIVALAQFYCAKVELINIQNESRLALSTSDQLRNRVLSWDEGGPHPGVISSARFNEDLPKFSKILKREGLGLGVKLLALSGETLLLYGEPANFSRTLSFPVILQTKFRKRSCRMVVWLWGK